jgi:uncharacterized protein YjeT (DUF2065 family)
MWHELGVGLALVLVIEGILPFLSPRLMRETLKTALSMSDGGLRLLGLTSMLAGLGLLYLIR